MSSTSSRGWAWIRAWGQSGGRDLDILKVSYAGLYFMMLGAGGRKWSRPFFCERMSESSRHRAKGAQLYYAPG